MKSPGPADPPKNLPVPIDDGACDHLAGRRLPSVRLPSTAGRTLDISRLSGLSVIFCYPHTGRPDQPTPAEWDAIPGARGCTPQSCAFRDRHSEFAKLGAAVYGLSADETEWQREAVERLQLPYELLSDSSFAFVEALRLPTFTFESRRYIKRLTLLNRGGRIEKVFYPVFPSDRNAADVLAHLGASEG